MSGEAEMFRHLINAEILSLQQESDENLDVSLKNRLKIILSIGSSQGEVVVQGKFYSGLLTAYINDCPSYKQSTNVLDAFANIQILFSVYCESYFI